MNMIVPVQSVKIADTHLKVIKYKNEPVVTLAMIDAIHMRVKGTAKRTFNANKDRFKAGFDYFELTSDEIRSMSDSGIFPQRTARATLISQRGYLKIVKSLNDDRAWQVQDDMIDVYFKAKQATPVDLSDPNVVMALLQDQTQQNIENQKVIADQAETIASQNQTVTAFDRIAKSEGSMCITDAAKTLQVPPRELFAYMKQNGWIYSRPGTSWLGYQSKINVGYLEHKVTDVRRDDGTSKTTTQVRVTPKGLTRLSELFEKS